MKGRRKGGMEGGRKEGKEGGWEGREGWKGERRDMNRTPCMGGGRGEIVGMMQTANITPTHTHTHMRAHTACWFVVEQTQIQKIRTNKFLHSSLSGAKLLSVTRSSSNTSRIEQRCWLSRQRR